MNRNRYRLVFNTTLGMMVPVAETARSHCKTGRTQAACGTIALSCVLLAGPAHAELPVASTNFAASGTTANYQVNGAQAYVNQVGNKAIVNFQTANISAGNDLRFQQVDTLAKLNLVPGANFSVLARIHDINPSVIAGSISQGAGQQANVIMVNSNGIAFMGGSQVNLNSFTASTLNIADDYILKTLLPKDALPQFEKALDGGVARGFIKVFPNARITASDQGRVMLIAPTLVNKGKVEAADGQVILAAGTKAFLRSGSAFGDDNVRGLLVEVDSPASLNDFNTLNGDVKDGKLDGNTVALQEAALDRLGHAINLGELSSSRGNVTMVGYAVNQQGIARATTSVVANGSVYLLAKDRTEATNKTSPVNATNKGSRSDRGGRVVLGAGSLTEVLPDTADATGALDGETGQGLARVSRVQVLGQDIRMEGGAVVNAPSGEVSFVAVDEPKNLSTDTLNTNDPFKNAGKNSLKARVHVADGARINVAGLENVQVSAVRNSVEVELRGDELKDTPVNQVGPLKGQKVYLDVNRALANANAGKSTLIAKDSLESYQAKLARGAAERSTAGGLVKVQSQGEAIFERGVTIDLSGGSVQYTAANLKTTLLTSNGQLTDLADANAETRYDGIATRYIVDYGRWNRQDVIDLGQSFRHDPGYVEGRDAGALEIMGLGGTVLQADVIGRTTVGELQRDAGQTPAGARLQLGSGLLAKNDYKLNQRIEVSSTAALLPKGFGFGDTLPVELKTVLGINPASVGKDKIAQLEVFSNQAVEVREALRMPEGGRVKITAQSVNVAADVAAPGGDIDFSAKPNTQSGTLPSSTYSVNVGKGVSVSARGAWINQSAAMSNSASTGASIDGGSVILSALGNIELEEGSHIDVTSGARVKPDGKITGGKGGAITINANDGQEGKDDHPSGVKLAGKLSGYGLAGGGSLTVSSGKIQIGGTKDTVLNALNLDDGFVARGGFSSIALTGNEGLTVADGVTLAPVLQTLELQPGATLRASGSRIEGFTKRVALDPRLRKPVNLTLTADDLALGDVRIGEGARIELDDKAKIAMSAARRIELLGQVRARGGDISAQLKGSLGDAFDPASMILLGEAAILDASGVARTYLDNRGLTQGNVLSGGKVSLKAQTGYVVTATSSKIDVSGVAPVRLDVLNETGGLGRNIGSDAGAVSIVAREGALLDGVISAGAGSATNRGGVFSLTLGDKETATGDKFPTGQRVIRLADMVPPQTTGLAPGSAIPAVLGGQVKLGAAALEAAGFDRIKLNSRNAIRLEDGLNLGASRALPLREVTLDSPRIETAGGDAALHADVLRLGNYDIDRQNVVNTPVAGSGTFKASARFLELAGNQTFTGMARAELSGEQEIRLAGVSVDNKRPAGMLQSAADMVLHGALIAPATYVQHTLSAPGRSVEFTRNTNNPIQPLSALGSLTVDAAEIVQNGNIWAPFGQLEFNASKSLVFKNGSLSSVAAAPGSLTPFGKLLNGQDWKYVVGNTLLAQDALADKAIRVAGASVDMQAGAKLDLAGGGDLQAYEFTVGPGGSRDILADTNTYAIVPGTQRGFAPGDAQETFDRANGEAVYLSGVPGLVEGVYTLLPAHYALLPGAYAVQLNTGVADVMPGQAYSRQDGVRIAAGYVTDGRAGAPKDARWQGVQVLTHEQVRARSEFTLTRASDFFADSRNRPQDAGLLSIATSGSGATALKLDAIYNMAAGTGGRGAQVDISALKLAVTSGTPSGIDPAAVVLDSDKLNALGADSLFIGGTRTMSADTTTLSVGAQTLTLANDASHTLKASEILLAAKDSITLKAGSAIDAQGKAGDAGHYETAGNGAFVRAASTSATFARTGNPDRSQGTLAGEVGSTIIAADSVTLDATKKNDYKGTVTFKKIDSQQNYLAVAGNLGVGATRVNFGAAGTEGITYTQADLDALNLKGLTLTSYSTFDLYGAVKVGQLDANGKPVVQNLTLQGAGLVGKNNAGMTAQLNAQNLTLTNPNSAASFTAVSTLGSSLAVTADTLTLGKGDKAIKGFGAVTVTANELVGSGTGTLAVEAPMTLNVARIGGERGADQQLKSTSGALMVANRIADRALAPISTLGAKWALAGTSVDFNSHIELPSGSVKLSASGGDVKLGANANVDVAGRTVNFFDVTKPSWGGTAEFISDTGDVNFNGAKVDVSAAPGGDAGSLIVSATSGKFLATGTITGAAPADASGKRGEGARALIDVKELPSFSTLNTALNSGGFDGARDLRVRTGNVSIADSDTVRALNIRVAADGGALDVAGKLDASGKDAGRIELFAKNDVNIDATASLNAVSSGAKEDGGDIEIGSREGFIKLLASKPGKGFNVAGGAGGQGGTVLLRAERTANDVKIGALASSGLGSARSVSVEAVKTYSNINTLNATGASSGSTLSLATLSADNTAFAANHATIKKNLGAAAANPNFHILSGVEIRSAGDLTLSQDWNLKDSRANGEAGVLTLRADGNLKINSNLSDGFSHATACTTATCAATPVPATLLAGDSWSYHLIAGADSTAANPLAVKPGSKDFTLANGKLIRTGTGDIRIASGRDIQLGDNKSAIYTAGRAAGVLANFIQPANAQYSQGGGDIVLAALGDVSSTKRSQQLYSNWLFRQGSLNADQTAYALQPSWWVRFDQFQQGVGALGGGDVTLTAGGKVQNISASAPTQARMNSTTLDASALVKTGGGSVRVETGGDVLGGQYYADNGELVIRAGGKLDTGEKVVTGGSAKPLYTILALGDAQATVRARDDVNIHAVLNPHLVVQSTGTSGNISGQSDPRWSLFSTYSDDSSVALESLNGGVIFHNVATTSTQTVASLQATYQSQLNFNYPSRYNAALLSVLPPSLSVAALQGDVNLVANGTAILSPALGGGLSVLAAGSVALPGAVRMLDTEKLPSPILPGQFPRQFGVGNTLLPAVVPVHIGDTQPVRIYAVDGDVNGAANQLNLKLPKQTRIRAGRDIANLGIEIQHVDATDVSRIEAGRDFRFDSQAERSSAARVWVSGPGRLELTAGRDLNLGTSAGVVSRGNLDNTALPNAGADIHLAAGVGAPGIDYAGSVKRLAALLATDSTDDTTLWLARWLTGDAALNEANALAEVQAIAALDVERQRARVREMVYTAMRTTGRDSLRKDSGYAADYARGYAALELVFPGISAKGADGRFENYQGGINLFASRVKTERGGNIEFMIPGGGLVVGLSNTPEILVKTTVTTTEKNKVTDLGPLGIVIGGTGDIKGFARDNILVNQSRILTVAGGDVLLWSSEGDIDAGKGKKTATAVPPPVIQVDADGNVTQELQGAASGSGIGALSTGNGTAGDVDLIAPKGTVNAGDAGIRAGNLNIAAQVVLGADNISVSGTSTGTPVADVSAVTAATSGASTADGGVGSATKALSQGLSDAARVAEEMKQAFKPTFISAEVIGHGDCEPGEKPPCKR